MSQRIKETQDEETGILSDRLEKRISVSEDKENIRSNHEPREKKHGKKSPEVQNGKAKLEKKKFENQISPAVKTEVKVNYVGFWSKKLQDLEKSLMKNKKSELYEFSCTEESDVLNIIKKKPRQKKGQIQKRKQPVGPKYNRTVKDSNKVLKSGGNNHKQPLLKKETVIKERKRKKLTDQHKNLACPSGIQSVAFTSTPAVNKSNLVDPSIFLLLSPITKEESQYSRGINENPPVKLNDKNESQGVKNFDEETPKIETKLKRISCRRVLRSGKMLTE